MKKETLDQIIEYILVGMTEREACALASFSYNELQEIKERSPATLESIERCQVQFKFNHLKEIQKSKSEKTSMWILEKLRPDDFGGGRRPPGDSPTVNIINAIIKDIQNDNQGIVKITRGAIREASITSDDTKPRTGAALLV